ncbi:MAG: (2Fe-2S) ferredoxin domain-containing protein [Eubacteriaceae bacterium]|jgi:NADP-reducing hydrogenase subunit HndB
MKKSLEELRAIRDRKKAELDLRKGKEGYKVVVGMATCGIAAGARPVMVRLMEEVNKRHLDDVTVAQTGCIGLCRLEPLVDVIEPDGEKVTYVHMTPEKMSRVVEEHLVGGKPVRDYTMNILDGQIIDPVIKEQ